VCLDAVMHGIPVVVLGDGIAKPLSGTLDEMYHYTDDERDQLLNDIAYCQWTLDEIKSGEALINTIQKDITCNQ